MPKTPSTGFWHQPRLWNCAKAGMLIVCTCRLCRRSVTYLAADLLEYFRGAAEGEARSAAPLPDLRAIGQLWGKCPRCGSVEFWSEQERYPSSEDVGHTRIRRPAGYRRVPLWRDEWYEPPTVPTRAT